MIRAIGVFFIAIVTSVAFGDGSSHALVNNGHALISFSGTQYFYDATAKLPGDSNNDGKVDVSDLGILSSNYGRNQGATWSTGDFNGDGKVDVSDLGILSSNYGNVGLPPRTLDVRVDYAVFAPGQFANSGLGQFGDVPLSRGITSGYDPTTDYVYAYQIFNQGPQTPGNSTVFVSYIGNNSQPTVSDLGQIVDTSNIGPNRGEVTSSGVYYFFPTQSDQLNPDRASTILLITSRLAPEYRLFTIMDSITTDTQLMSFPGVMPVPVPMSVFLGFMGLGLVDRLKRRV